MAEEVGNTQHALLIYIVSAGKLICLCPDWTFGLAGLETAAQAVFLYRLLDLLPARRWAAGRKERTRYCTAYGSFTNDLLQKLVVRADHVGRIRALAELELKR